jgi:hypothetical protein
MKTLNLTLKKKWFDMISSGEKKEEYREIKEYWEKRLISNFNELEENGGGLVFYNDFDQIQFRNGYAKNAPTMTVECKGIEIGEGKPEWGAEIGKKYFVIKLGKILSIEK